MLENSFRNDIYKANQFEVNRFDDFFFTCFQKTLKEIVITEPRRISNYSKHNGVQTGQHITQLSERVMCPEATCSSQRLSSSRTSGVSSKQGSAALELEWEGIDLIMEDGFEMIELCKKEEV